jgi:hypothetical protein
MSHNVVATIAQKRAEGRPLFKDLAALQAACVALGVRAPVKKLSYFPGKNGQREVYAFKFPERNADQGNHWHSDVIVDVETGEDYFDNYSPYTANHQDVKSGKRRLGENGRWGRIERLWELDEEYKKAVVKITADQMIAEAKKLGQPVVVNETLDNGLKRHLRIGNPKQAKTAAALR